MGPKINLCGIPERIRFNTSVTSVPSFGSSKFSTQFDERIPFSKMLMLFIVENYAMFENLENSLIRQFLGLCNLKSSLYQEVRF